jgi:hypothetical protein
MTLAKELSQQLDLFDVNRYDGKITQNLREVYALIDISVQDAIRIALPLQNILESSFEKQLSSDSESENEMHDDRAPMSFEEGSVRDHAPDVDDDPPDDTPNDTLDDACNDEYDNITDNYDTAVNDDMQCGSGRIPEPTDDAVGLLDNVVGGRESPEIKEVPIETQSKDKKQTFF